MGAKIAEKHIHYDKDNSYIYRLMRQACTVGIMCPTMSLVASILFNLIMGGRPVADLPAI